MLTSKGFKIGNIDANILLEQPKLAPYLPQMILNLSEHLKIPASQINVKAKRGEGMDAVGEGKAVAAQAIALILSGL